MKYIVNLTRIENRFLCVDADNEQDAMDKAAIEMSKNTNCHWQVGEEIIDYVEPCN